MAAINSALAADLAYGVYEILEYITPKQISTAISDKFSNVLETSSLKIGLGKTGTLRVIKSQTAFAFAAQGKGPYNTHGFLVFRGTEKSYAGDWLTNSNNSFFWS